MALATSTLVTRYAGNPVILHGDQAWHDSQVFDPVVMINPADSDELLMFLSGMEAPVEHGTMSIGLYTADRSDPFTWTHWGQILEPTGTGSDFDGIHVRLDSVVWDDDEDEFKLYYTGSTTGGANAVGLATSPTAKATFTRYGSNPILTPNGQGRDDGDFVSQFAVIKEGSSDWKGVYCYRDGGTILPGYRWASSSDGLSWTKEDAWDAGDDLVNYAPQFVEWHQFFKKDGRYFILFEKGNGSTDFHLYMISAEAPEGPYYPEKTILANTGVDGDFDEFHVATGFLAEIDGVTYLFYCGGEDHAQPYGTNHFSIGMATVEPYEFPDTTDLVSYWRLEDLADAFGSNTLTNNNAATFGAAVVDNGVTFNGTNQSLSHASNSDLQTGDIDFTFAFAFKLLSIPAVDAAFSLITKDDDAANSRDYTIDYSKNGTPAEGLRFYVKGGGGGFVQTTALVPNIWHYAVLWYDKTANTLNIEVDGVGGFSEVTTDIADVSSAQFMIGQREYSGFEDFAHVSIDEVCFFKRLLDADEREALLNFGLTTPLQQPDTAGAARRRRLLLRSA